VGFARQIIELLRDFEVDGIGNPGDTFFGHVGSERKDVVSMGGCYESEDVNKMLPAIHAVGEIVQLLVDDANAEGVGGDATELIGLVDRDIGVVMSAGVIVDVYDVGA
jgi:hypothetical protein